MKITIEPTGEFQRVNGEPARIWTGFDEHGVAVVAHVRVVSPQTHDPAANERYGRALTELGHNERALPFGLDTRHLQ